MAVYTCQCLYKKDVRAERMSRVRVPVEIPIDTLGQTTTFYTQDEVVALVHKRRPGFDFWISNDISRAAIVPQA